jgi:predicted metal-dependent peptidase
VTGVHLAAHHRPAAAGADATGDIGTGPTADVGSDHGVRRPLRPDEVDDLAAARLLALDWMPYLATALFEVTPVASPGLGTFAVDARWRLYVDPAQLLAWGPRDAAGVLLHEVGHLLRAHHDRHAEHPRSDALLWNLAGDAEINDDLRAAGIPLPGSPITPGSIAQPDGQLAERYFEHLLQECDDAPDPACGSGAGGRPVACEADEEGLPPGRTPLDQDLIRRKVAQDVEVAGGHGGGAHAGSVPGGWRRWAAELLAPPAVAWERRLRQAVRRGLALRAGQLDTSYRRPGRRRVPNVVTPGMVRPQLHVGVVLDTSSSMSEAQLRTAIAELDAICRRAGIGPDERVVVTADVDVHEVPRLRHARQLPILGGGGTDLRPALAYVHQHRRRPHVIVVLTDGFTPWPSEVLTGSRVIAVLIDRTDGQVPPDPPSWIDTIRIATRT